MMGRLRIGWSMLRAVPVRMMLAVTPILSAIVWLSLEPDAWLARVDLTPWTGMWTAVVLFLGGGRTGSGPHPRLTPIQTPMGQLALMLAGALPTLLLVALYEVGLGRQVFPAEEAVAAVLLLMGGALWLSRDQGRTAWVPIVAGQRWRLLRLATLSGLALLASSLLGLAVRDDQVPTWIGAPWVATAGFVACGYVHTRAQDLDQYIVDHRARGITEARLDHAGVRRVLAATLPAVGLTILHMLPGYGLDSIITVLLLAYIVPVVWPWPTPASVGVLLHVVEPRSRLDANALSAAPAVDTSPPQGTLRFTPGDTQTTQVVLPWEVPVRQVVDAADDYATQLWPRWPEPADAHVLGTPRMAVTEGRVDLSRVVADSAGSDSLHQLMPGDMESRRVAVYLPTHAAAEDDADPGTFVWDDPGTRSQLVELDATPRIVSLTDGAVIILAAGAVTQLYEVELGAARPLALGPIPPRPWYQDYVKP